MRDSGIVHSEEPSSFLIELEGNIITLMEPESTVSRLTCVIVLLTLSVAALSCTGAAQQTSADNLEGRSHNSERGEALEVAARLSEQLPDLLGQAAQQRANQLTIDTLLAAPTEHFEGVELHRIDYLRKLYGANGHQPVWVELDGTSARPNSSLERLRDALHHAVQAHGLWADELHLDKLEVIEFGDEEDSPSKTREAFAGAEMDEAERRATARWLADQSEAYRSDRDFTTLISELASKGGPLERFHMPVQEQVSRLRDVAEKTSRADVLFSDAFVHYAISMRFENPAWQRGVKWPERLQPPAEDVDGRAEGDEQGEQVDETSLEGEELEEARRRHLVLRTLGPVFEDASHLDHALAELAPPFEPYQRLTEAFERYRKIVEHGGWPPIPEEAEGLKRGATNEHIPTVKERLRIEGYYDGDDSQTFDDELRRAILSYQSTHQLWENGWLTPQTMRSLNETATKRWNQIRLTLQRWRESRVGPDDHYIHVNIPDFHASVWRQGEREMYFKVVVGATTKKKTEEGDSYFRHATPRFSDEMEYLVFNPYWNVPQSIREEELEPQFEEDPATFEEKGYEYYTDDNGHRFLRQKPGPQNALGRVKFIFPNRYNVYLHDTPKKQLFEHPFRAYSHGCVRVQDPMELAHYLLDLDGRWKDEKREEKLDEWFAKDSPTWVKLRESVPIHIEYYVVRIDDDGHANFLADLYRLDRPRLDEITRKVETLQDSETSEHEPSQTAQSDRH